MRKSDYLEKAVQRKRKRKGYRDSAERGGAEKPRRGEGKGGGVGATGETASENRARGVVFPVKGDRGSSPRLQ